MTEYNAEIDFEWTDYRRAAEFAALNSAVVTTCARLDDRRGNDRVLDRMTGMNA